MENISVSRKRKTAPDSFSVEPSMSKEKNDGNFKFPAGQDGRMIFTEEPGTSLTSTVS